MTPQQIAEQLNGIEYPCDIHKAIEASAKEHGIVIVFGASDDLMEFRGAIYDEWGCYDGGTVKVDATGPLRDWDDVKEDGEKTEIAAWLEREKKAKEIEAIWAPDSMPGTSWVYNTTIPHVTFNVMEDGDIYCRGIVFELKDLRA